MLEELMQKKERLTKVQKAGAVLVFVFSFLIVGVGVLQMRNNIYNPLAIKLENNSISDLANAVNEDEKLKAIDTDQDGINDYEELYTHETSPYLSDTDSDGMGDREEIALGEDPNCPKGKVCGDVVEQKGASTTPDLFLVGNGDVDLSLSSLGVGNGTGVAYDPSNLKGVLDSPEKIREMLLKSGKISEVELAKIDDQTLMGLVEKIKTNLDTGSATPKTGAN